MRSFLASILAFLSTLFPLISWAESQYITLSHEQQDEVVLGETREWPYETKNWSLSYGLDLNPQWQFVLSYGQGGETKNFDDPVRLDTDNKYFGLSVAYSIGEASFLELALVYSESTLKAERTDRFFLYEEDLRAWDVMFRGGRRFYLGDWSVTPSMGLGYQSSDQRLQTERVSLLPVGDTRFPFLTGAQDITDSGLAYLSANVGADYSVWQNDSVLVYFSSGIDWVEPLSDDTINTYRQSISARGRSFSSDEVKQSLEGEGSGSAYFSANVLISQLLIGVTWSESIDVPEVGRALIFDLGMSF